MYGSQRSWTSSDDGYDDPDMINRMISDSGSSDDDSPSVGTPTGYASTDYKPAYSHSYPSTEPYASGGTWTNIIGCLILFLLSAACILIIQLF